MHEVDVLVDIKQTGKRGVKIGYCIATTSDCYGSAVHGSK